MTATTLHAPLAWWHANTLDLGACEPVEIVTALRDDESADARMASWPEDIRAQSQTIARRWLDEHPDCTLMAVTTGIGTDSSGSRCCVLMLSYRKTTEVKT